MGEPLATGWLTELLEVLATVEGVRSATLNPADLNLPGVLVRPTGFELTTLTGTTATADLFVVVPDSPHAQAFAELTTLGNRVLEVIDPAGAVRVATVQLPDGGGRLPALLIPYDTPTT